MSRIPDEEYRTTCEHLQYEIRMFQDSYRRHSALISNIGKRVPPTTGPIEGYVPSLNSEERFELCAYLEVFLLHCRNLIEFFQPDRDLDPRSTQTRYSAQALGFEHLFTKGEPIVKTIKDKINISLSHISKERTSSMKWEIDRIYKQLTAKIEEFRSKICPGT